MSAFQGIWGKPFINLEGHLDLGALGEVHEEICLSLTRVALGYTGGSHKWMGIVPPSLAGEPYADYGQVIAGFSREEFRTFVSLSDAPDNFDEERRHAYEFGEERDHPLSRRQVQYLKIKYGVYFPWKAYYEMIPDVYWDEKSEPRAFSREARLYFPRTLALVRALPFKHIGRCNLLGLEANDHGTVHRDGVPEDKPEVDQFITLVPGGKKRLFLWDEAARAKTYVTGRAYWFNDSDYHGVEPDPFFRYSLRVDGVFTDEFVEALGREHAAR